MTRTALLAIDQGTTSSRALAFDLEGREIARAQEEFAQIYPQPGWVEHDPEVIWATVLTTARKAFEAAETQGFRVAALGLTNQRETSLIWDRATGRPVSPAIVWQDRRTAPLCARLKAEGAEPALTERTGLVLDPYFSATKIGWILDSAPGLRAKAEAGALAFGTVDSWLVWRLTGGRRHLIEATNASRTALYGLETGAWDPDMLALFGVPEAVLPVICDSAGRLAESDPGVFGRALPITGIAGDQHAAAIGQACLEPGEVKSTYGTGAFMLAHTGSVRVRSQARLLSTLAWRIRGESRYALEGSILSAGATVQWLRDGLGIVARASEVEALAAQADPDSGVYLVPAFTGLGAPWWAPEARTTITGLTRGAGRAEIARAALDSVAYQTADLLDAMAADGARPVRLKADGGMAENAGLMQRIADLCAVETVRPENAECTAWGAAVLAGLGVELLAGMDAAATLWRRRDSFSPAMGEPERLRRRTGWYAAVRRACSDDRNNS